MGCDPPRSVPVVPVGVGCPRSASELCVVTTAVAAVPALAELPASATVAVGK